MTPLWLSVMAASLGCYALKLAGVSLPARVLNHPRVQRVAAVLPVGMLSGLVAVELLDVGGRYGWDGAQAGGVAAGLVALLSGRGVLGVFVTAVGATAVLRLLL